MDGARLMTFSDVLLGPALPVALLAGGAVWVVTAVPTGESVALPRWLERPLFAVWSAFDVTLGEARCIRLLAAVQTVTAILSVVRGTAPWALLGYAGAVLLASSHCLALYMRYASENARRSRREQHCPSDSCARCAARPAEPAEGG